jgi:integrase
MTKKSDRSKAILSASSEPKPSTSRHAAKKSPRADSSDFSAIADGYIEAANAVTTRRCFESDMRHLSSHGIFPENPPSAVLEYLAKFAGIHAISTLERRLVSLHKAATIKKLPSPAKEFSVRQAMQGIRRTYGVRPRRVTPVVKETLLEMLICGEQVQKTFQQARDCALLMLMFSAALRRSEAVALEVADLKFLDDGMEVLIRRSKTDAEGRGAVIFVPLANGNRCPVAAMHEWLAISQISTGPIFRAITRGDRVLPNALSSQSVALIVKRAVNRIGKNADDFSGHSMRAGFCTAASTAGLANWQIRAVSRHVNDVHLATYVRPLSSKTPSLL